MSRLFLDEIELRRIGMSETNISTLRALAKFVDLQSQVSTAQDDITANADSIAELAANDVALSAEISANTSAISTLDSRIDAYDAHSFVDQDQAAAPAYTPYAGQTVSVGYIQAEAQATDDAVVVLGAVVDGLKTALQTANVLT